MRIVVVGGSGTIGKAVVAALSQQNEVLALSRGSQPLRVDIAEPASICSMYQALGFVDAVVSTAGAARFAPLSELDDEAFAFSLANKLMGQVNLVRLGFDHVRDRGSFVLTSGILSRAPMKGSAAVSLVNSALEGFARAAALEAPRGIRVNVVSPPWVTETLRALGMDTAPGLPAATVAQAYVHAVSGSATGAVLEPKGQ